MWPFKRKRQEMTVDVAAKIFADKIRLDIEPYTLALDRFAVTHDNNIELSQILGELWIFQLTLLDYIWSLTEFPTHLRDRMLPIIVVGHAKLDHKHYIARSHYYGEKISTTAPEKVLLVAGNALAEIIDNDYFGYKEANGKKLFWGAVSSLATKTMKSLSDITFDVHAKYEIIL